MLRYANIFFIGFLAVCTDGIACQCVSNPQLPEPELVVVATVRQEQIIEHPETDEGLKDWTVVRYRVDIQRTIRGTVSNQIDIETSYSDCGAGFEVGKKYLIFLR